jgi:hypothetical protein
MCETEQLLKIIGVIRDGYRARRLRDFIEAYPPQKNAQREAPRYVYMETPPSWLRLVRRNLKAVVGVWPDLQSVAGLRGGHVAIRLHGVGRAFGQDLLQPLVVAVEVVEEVGVAVLGGDGGDVEDDDGDGSLEVDW